MKRRRRSWMKEWPGHGEQPTHVAQLLESEHTGVTALRKSTMDASSVHSALLPSWCLKGFFRVLKGLHSLVTAVATRWDQSHGLSKQKECINARYFPRVLQADMGNIEHQQLVRWAPSSAFTSVATFVANSHASFTHYKARSSSINYLSVQSNWLHHLVVLTVTVRRFKA